MSRSSIGKPTVVHEDGERPERTVTKWSKFWCLILGHAWVVRYIFTGTTEETPWRKRCKRCQMDIWAER